MAVLARLRNRVLGGEANLRSLFSDGICRAERLSDFRINRLLGWNTAVQLLAPTGERSRLHTAGLTVTGLAAGVGLLYYGRAFCITLIVSVILGSIATPLLLPGASGLSGQIGTLALRISLLPAIAAISYELQRFSARHCTTGPLRVLLWPGFLFQKITTRQPDDSQIEIAIAAMQSAFWRQREGERAPDGDQVRVFPSLEGALAHYGDGAPARA